MPKSGYVTDASGKVHVVQIAGDAPTPEEQAEIDKLAGGGVNAPTLAGAAEAQSPQSQLAGEARTLENDARNRAESARNNYSALSGLAGGLIGTAVAPGVGTAVGAAVGAGLGPNIGNLDQTESGPANALGVGPTDDQLYKESAHQALFSLGMDATGAAAGKLGRGIVGIGDRARVISEIDDAASVGIRATAGDLGREWLRTARKVASIIPIIGAPFRAAEKNRAREIAAAIGRFRGPLDPLVGEAEMSAELLKAASNNFDSSIPWYKMFYQEAEQHAVNSGTRFDASAAVQRARDYSNAIERGRRILSRTEGNATETVSRRTVEQSKQSEGIFERSRTVRGSDQSTEGVITQTQPGQVDTFAVGPEGQTFQSRPNQAGQQTSAFGETSGTTGTRSTTETRARTETVRSSQSLSRPYNDASDTAAFLDDLQFTNPNLDFYQYDSLMKELDEAWKTGSSSQRVALTQVREQLENAAQATGDEKFNFLYGNAKKNFKLLKEFFANPQSKKFQLVDQDVFDTSTSALKNPERQEGSQLFRNVFQPEMGPDGVRDVAKMVQPTTMDRAVRLNVRQRLDKHLLDAEGGKIDWAGIHAEFGLNDPTSLRYQTFKEMLANSRYGMTVDEFKKGLMTIEEYTGNKLPELSTQLVRSVSLGGPGSAIRNISGSRAFNLEGHATTIAGKLLAKFGVVGALVGTRSLSNFLADPDRLRVLLRYVDEGMAAVPGSSLPKTVKGLPIPGLSEEVGSGARQTYLATKKPVMRAVEKRLVQWLAFDLAHKTQHAGESISFKTKEIADELQWAVDHPDETRENLGNDVKSLQDTTKSLFQNYLSGGQIPK